MSTYATLTSAIRHCESVKGGDAPSASMKEDIKKAREAIEALMQEKGMQVPGSNGGEVKDDMGSSDWKKIIHEKSGEPYYFNSVRSNIKLFFFVVSNIVSLTFVNVLLFCDLRLLVFQVGRFLMDSPNKSSNPRILECSCFLVHLYKILRKINTVYILVLLYV